MIHDDGWGRFSVWRHSSAVRELYARRCRREEPEMTCAAQAAELLAPLAAVGDTLLDAGCGGGHFFHSLRERQIDVEYHGVDAEAGLIEIGRTELPAFGLPPERLRPLRIEDLAGKVDHVLCMNVISNVDNYHRPLDRLAGMARKSLILRESLADAASYRYVRDEFLDPDAEVYVHVNAYDRREVVGFLAERGFAVREVTDRRTGGAPELVIGHPHHWTFLVAEREESA